MLTLLDLEFVSPLIRLLNAILLFRAIALPAIDFSALKRDARLQQPAEGLANHNR